MKVGFKLKVIGTLLAALACLTVPAYAQNCALCYTQASSAGARLIEALRSGILVLVIPPTLGSIAMIFVVRHKHGQYRGTDGAGESGQEW